MKRALVAILALCAAGPALAVEKRCGWIDNPTPGNWWLTDSQGEWLLGAQGGYQAPGMDNMPDLSEKGWVRTYGYYGYGCACLTVETDARTKRVTRLIAASQLPLRKCRADKALERRSTPRAGNSSRERRN